MLVDVGVNLTHRRFAKDVGQVLQRAVAAGVEAVVITGTSIRESRQAVDLVRKFGSQLRLLSTAGIHPHDAKTFKPESLSQIRELFSHPCVGAVGECGLDYNRNFSTPEQQRHCFQAQVELAVELSAPLFVHEREAHEDLVAILDQYEERLPPVVIHCFTGTTAEAEAYVRRGYYLGFTGCLCMDRRGRHLRALCPSIPLHRTLVETDAPFMYPLPGKKARCEPCHVAEVVRTLAECHGVSFEEAARQTTEAAHTFFRIRAPSPDAATVRPAAPGKSTTTPAAATTAAVRGAASRPSPSARVPAVREDEFPALGTPASGGGSLAVARHAPCSVSKESPLLPYVDTHAHLDEILQQLHVNPPFEEWDPKRAFGEGFDGVVAQFCDPAAFSPSFQMYDTLLAIPGVFGAFGIHPHHAKYFEDSGLQGRLELALRHPRAVALGEIGLDFRQNRSPQATQRDVFRQQLRLATALGKPVVVHCAEAEDAVLQILQEELRADHKVHLHCFTGNAEQASRFLEAFPLLFLGFTGFVTFRSAKAVATRDALRTVVPLGRILLETDGPHMKPEPVDDAGDPLAVDKKRGGGGRRGRRGGPPAHPGDIPQVAEAIARLKRVDVREVLLASRENTRQMYGV